MVPKASCAIEGDGVAYITLDNGPVNALHPKVLEDLFTHLRAAQSENSVKAIVIEGARGKFSGGFDISEFQKGSADSNISRLVNEAFLSLVETGPKPTVAALSGLALGGGCELAIACNARIATPGTKIGLPELSLGIIPGFGGTQRLPRLIGLQKAIEMMLTSQAVSHTEALQLGLIDAVAEGKELRHAAGELALAIAARHKPRRVTIDSTAQLEALGEAEAIIAIARQEATKRVGSLRHPQLCLDAVEAGVRAGGRRGIEAEAKAFATAQRLPTHKALVHFFFAQRTTKQVRGVTDQGLTPRRMRTVAVLGGGLMGSGIATALVLAGVDVILKEINQAALDAGYKRIDANLASRVKRGALARGAADAARRRVRGALDYGAFRDADMVIEAAVERLDLKQRIFAELEAACGPDCILASNTSTISLELVGAKTRAAERVVGAHFFSPAHIMPLLEVVRTPATSPQVVLDTLELGLCIKKTPVVVGNCTGFAVNRVFFPYTMAACLLADLGAEPYMVDKAIKAFGMPMGPFRLSDLVGIDVGLHVGANFIDSFPERIVQSQLIPALHEAGRLGEKSGAGFYRYAGRGKQAPDAEGLAPFLQRSRAAANLLEKRGAFVKAMKPMDIINFIFFPVVNEGCRVIAEGIVDKAADLDVASVMAMGFPAAYGGLVFWADSVGAATVCKALDSWAAALPEVAGFFEPCKYLRRCAESKVALGQAAGTQSVSKL